MLSEHYFGDVEAIDEGKNHPEYFSSTFLMPTSIAISSLRNDRNFIIVGRKGSGKTALQFYFSGIVEKSGYFTHFFSFYNDMKAKDYNSAVAAQRIDLLQLNNNRNIFLNYDFRDVWKRTLLIKIAETLRSKGLSSKFIQFMLDGKGRLSSIFEGLLKSSSVKLSANMVAISGEIGFDLGHLANNEIPLSSLAEIGAKLLEENHRQHRMYLFVDELVFSKLDAHDDEVRVRAAMVRDIFRTARSLNNYFHQNGMDFHVICSVRPEIRDLINDLDAEIGKIFDGKTVDLNWEMGGEDDSLLYRLLKQKVIHSRKGETIDFDPFMSTSITFSDREQGLEAFLRTNTWSRPRDIVQLLNSVAYKFPASSSIGEREIKGALNEYGRRSFVEILEEISVRHGALISRLLRENVKQARYESFSAFDSLVLAKFQGVSRESLLTDLFNYGVIGNFADGKGKNRRYYWAHRGEEFLSKDKGISIHPGLWNYFNIR